MKNLQTFEEFLNESFNYKQTKLKTVRFAMKDIKEIGTMWRTGKEAPVKNILKKIEELISNIEEAYNKEQSTYDRPGKISDMQYDLVMLKGYAKDIKQECRMN